MRRSRVTLAMMLAAAMLRLSASPPTSAVCGTGRPRAGSPSIKVWSGGAGRAFTARAMARWVARRMLRRSISSTPAWPVDQTTPGCVARIAKNFSRRAAGIFFESFRPSSLKSPGRMTAAATTGPASGPRPASSTPATKRNPRARRARSRVRSQAMEWPGKLQAAALAATRAFSFTVVADLPLRSRR